MMFPPVFVVIPNYNGRQNLAYTLPSLAQTTYPTWQTVMVDNCSTDDSCDYVATHFPWVHVVRNSVNAGFAGGVNVGIRRALAHGARYIAICNNDIKVVPGWLEPVIELFENQKDVAVIGYTEIARSSQTSLIAPAEVRFRDVRTEVPGMLYVCKAEVFKVVGFYDEKYFMYGEESDLFARIQRAGYRILQTNIPVWHYVGGSTQQARFKIAWLSHRNGIRYTIKNGSLVDILRQVVALLYYAIVPDLRPASENPLVRMLRRPPASCTSEESLEQFRIRQQRLRPGHPIINTCVWGVAVLWNLVFLPQTLMARHRDNERIRRRWQ